MKIYNTLSLYEKTISKCHLFFGLKFDFEYCNRKRVLKSTPENKVFENFLKV